MRFHPFDSLFSFLPLLFFHLRCLFVVTVFTVSCSLSPSSPLLIDLLPKDFFPAKKPFSFDFSKFSIILSFIYCVCFFFFDCVGVVCLERKWTYQCPNFGLFGFPARSFCLFGLNVLVSKSRAFYASYLLLCHHCICVVVLRLCYHCNGAMCAIFRLSSMKELLLQVSIA